MGVLSEKSRQIDRETYKTDSETRDIVERRFVKMTEATINIGTVLVVHERGKPAASNPAAMQSLGEMGILSDGLADDLAASARFRNVLAHTYGDAIDDDVVYDALSDLERYRAFVIAVREYLESIGALED